MYDNCAELMRSLACNGRECCHCELTQNETKCIVDDKYGRNTLVHPLGQILYLDHEHNLPPLSWMNIAEWCYLRVQWNPLLGDPPPLSTFHGNSFAQGGTRALSIK